MQTVMTQLQEHVVRFWTDRGIGRDEAERRWQDGNRWLEGFRRCLVTEHNTRRRYFFANAQLSRLRARVRDRRLSATGPMGEFLRTKPWPPEHRLNEAGEAVDFPPDFWWNAPKTVFGENTSRQEKVRAFRCWVSSG